MIRPSALLLPAIALALPAFGAPVDFATQVQPLLETKCVECHNPEKIKGELQMHTAAALMKGGENGPIITAGQPDKSELIKRITLHKGDDDVMPPKSGGLPPEQVAVLKQWIAEGAPWPKDVVLKAVSEDEVKAVARLKAKLNRMKSIEILPGQFTLETKRDWHRVIVFARFDDDTTRDVTSFSEITIADPRLAKLEGDRLAPLADGATELLVTCNGRTAKAPVKVTGAAQDRPVSFKLDVMPVFMRSGCNIGGCHGSARGKDGFRLSLFGFDPDGDYIRITRENPGRRINLALPEESTLIEKSIGAVPHSGNQCFEEDSVYHKTLLEWITNGAPKDAADIPRVTGIEVHPKQCVMEGRGETQQVTVRATYSDGTDRDVTHLAVFMSNNDPAAAVSKAGLVTSGDRGEAFVLARFDTFSVGSQFIVIPDALKYERPKLAENNYIDTLVNEKLHKLRILPSGVCSDEAFLRRASIDIVGVLPGAAGGERLRRRHQSEEARGAGRHPAAAQGVHRDVGDEVGGAAPDAQQGTTTRAPIYKNALLYYNWLRGPHRQEHPDQRDRQGTACLPGRHLLQPRRELLPDRARDAQDHRERRPGLHGHAHPVRPVPQPSLRPLDDGRLLRLRGLLHPDRPQADR